MRRIIHSRLESKIDLDEKIIIVIAMVYFRRSYYVFEMSLS